MKLRYRAFDKLGAARTGTIEAPSVGEATESLRRDGLFVAEMTPTEGERSGADGGPATSRAKANLKNVASFLRQLSVLVSTGTPLVESIGALERQIPAGSWRGIVESVRRRVEEGAPLSEAMAAYPRAFDAVCRSLVRAGESSGKLDQMLTRLAELTKQQLRIRQQVIGAMVYPCLLVVVSFGVLGVMLLFVLPKFTGLFDTLKMELPPTTKFLMALSASLVEWWYVYLGLIVSAVVGGRVWLGTSAGRESLDVALVRLPQVGRMTRGFATARIARLMGVLLESRVQLLDALELTKEACVNVQYARLIDHARDVVTRGEPLSSAIGRGGLINGSVVEAVRNAERAGRIGPVLTGLADFIDEENQTVLKAVTGLIEPLILLTLGVVVGLVATSMFLPLFDLTAMAGGAPTGGATP
ncbi:MAG: type II secretion system F family protein [Phycisphaerales bacterium]